LRQVFHEDGAFHDMGEIHAAGFEYLVQVLHHLMGRQLLHLHHQVQMEDQQFHTIQ
jgi:hypothetical protein